MTRDEMEFQSWRYARVIRFVRLSSGALAVMDAQHQFLGFANNDREAEELTVICALAKWLARKPPVPRRIISALGIEL